MQAENNVSSQKIIEELTNILEPWLDDSESVLNEETDLINCYGIDSVGIIQIILGVEEKFNIRIEEYEIDTEIFSRVGNFINMIEDKLHETN